MENEVKKIGGKNKIIFSQVSPKIVITSFPRSGNNWICNIASRIIDKSIQNNNTELHHCRNGHVIIDIQREADLDKALKSENWSGIVKSHQFEVRKDYRIIYIFRDAREVLASFREWLKHDASNYKTDIDDNEFIDRYLSEVIQHWCKALLFKIKYPQNIHVISYSSLQKNPVKYLIGLTDFLGIKIGENELQHIVSECSFDKMYKSPMNTVKNGVPFIRKGKADKGRGEFRKPILRKIFMKSYIPYLLLCGVRKYQKTKRI